MKVTESRQKKGASEDIKTLKISTHAHSRKLFLLPVTVASVKPHTINDQTGPAMTCSECWADPSGNRGWGGIRSQINPTLISHGIQRMEEWQMQEDDKKALAQTSTSGEEVLGRKWNSLLLTYLGGLLWILKAHKEDEGGCLKEINPSLFRGMKVPLKKSSTWTAKKPWTPPPFRGLS